jgi:DNA-binding NtrC family response regulator
VLIVDDEVRVAEAIARVLSFDFDVSVVNSAREALALLLAGESFHLILCDLMMSEMSGMDFYEEVAQSLPATVGSLAFMTGGAFTARARQFVENVRCPCLDKPVDLKELRHLILR